jgi:hypothetical protein
MIADYVRDEVRAFPEHPDPAEVTAVRVWHCQYKSLASLSAFIHLKTLVIATYPDADLTVSGHEKLPIGGHEIARWRPAELPASGHEICPLPY